jgi:hypothetical protein
MPRKCEKEERNEDPKDETMNPGTGSQNCMYAVATALIRMLVANERIDKRVRAINFASVHKA